MVAEEDSVEDLKYDVIARGCIGRPLFLSGAVSGAAAAAEQVVCFSSSL